MPRFCPLLPPLEDAAAIKRPCSSPGFAPHGNALAIALDERVRGDDVGIPQEKSHLSLDNGGTIDGVVVGVCDADPAPGVHTEQSQAMVVVLPTRCGPC